MMNNVNLPDWCFREKKGLVQSIYDALFFPLRFILFPDEICEKFHLTSLRAERFSQALPYVKGRLLDVGAGDNQFIKKYSVCTTDEDGEHSQGVDVVDWGGGCQIVQSSAKLPFPDDSFDTISFIACLNHIPERKEAIAEAGRLLRPGGRILITMIGRLVGTVGHALWWYSEDKHRDVDDEEEMGMNNDEVRTLLVQQGFTRITIKSFCYGLNNLIIAEK